MYRKLHKGVQCLVCFPEDVVFSTPKHVGIVVKFSLFYFNFVYQLVKIHVVIIVRTRNG
jgi:hypothetical protein